jgi:class 3 adenylate cyclase
LSFSPSLLPIHDLAAGTERVAAGDYSQRLPVVQDDDLGALAASFNRMQAGLAERQRLQAAFGTYVDPALAARLLEQGDDVFTGERREVTVMFVDVRDFTPFAEANTAEDTVARLNALFEIVVPAVVEAGGHVNKFLGDGALAVFGAPNNSVYHFTLNCSSPRSKLVDRLRVALALPVENEVVGRRRNAQAKANARSGRTPKMKTESALCRQSSKALDRW